MPVASRLGTTDAESAPQPRRAVLRPAGNGSPAVVFDERKRKSERRLSKPRRSAWEVPALAVMNNRSVDSTCSSDSSNCGSSDKIAKCRRTVVSEKSAPMLDREGRVDTPERRCDWITLYSDPLYVCFHNEEWGVPVHDDKKLFELLVFSQALAELRWPVILDNRDIFRKSFDNFDPSSIAQLDEQSLTSLKVNGNVLLSETKLRVIIENAKQTLKIQKEFGSFSNFCWSFIQHRPIRHAFRYAREIPTKTPKAEVISKNLMRRGFSCVGPTIIYSFMQAVGMVNDHLTSCFRFQECNAACINQQGPN